MIENCMKKKLRERVEFRAIDKSGEFTLITLSDGERLREKESYMSF